MLKFTLPTLLLSCMSLFADSTMDPCCDPCIKCAQLGPNGGPDYMVTPNAGPCVANGADLFVTGEFIYWEARQDDMSFADIASIPKTTTGFFSSFTGSNYRHPNWRYEPGFKVGLGILFDYDGWDLYANYTWLRTTTHPRTVTLTDSTSTLEELAWIGIAPTFIGDNNPAFENISFQWKHHFNVVDLELGRNFFISCALQLRPHIGLKGTWQTQKAFASGSGFLLGITPFSASAIHHNDFWGVGIRGGLDTSWHFTRCFSLVGDIAMSALYGKFDTKSIGTNTEGTTTNLHLDTRNDFFSMKPVFEAFIGLRWEDWYCCNEYHVSIEAGWEEQWWGSQNQFFYLLTETRLGDLELSGLTLKVRFDF